MRRILVTACLILALVSCGGDDGDAAKSPSVITGTIVEVDSKGLTDVESFVVSSDDERYTILIDETTELDFPPAHLNEHRISGDPVRVDVASRNGELVAIRIEDG